MYTGFLHTHKLVVLLFLFLYVIKTALLFSKKEGALENFTKRTKVPEMVISTLFLVTGIYLVTQAATISMFLWIKFACVAASIPLAVIGFKKKNKALAVVSFLLLVNAYGMAEMHKKSLVKGTPAPTETTSGTSTAVSNVGKEIFNTNCTLCHGPAGDAGLSGASNLKTSEFSDEDIKNIVMKGKGTMPSFKSAVKESDLPQLIEYVKSLRTTK